LNSLQYGIITIPIRKDQAMKRISLLLILLSISIFYDGMLIAAEKLAQNMPFAVYTEKNSRTNHFVPSGWMGDYGAVKIDQGCKDNPYSGSTCIKIAYSGEPTQGAGWVGVYYQNPENNWGSKDGGFNLSNAKKLNFWAKGAKGGEKLEFKIGGITGTYPDSDMTSVGPLELTSEWKQYSIDLEGLDLSYISGGFVWAASKMDNQDGFVIYLDDIMYE
jgi:hypothetical protein